MLYYTPGHNCRIVCLIKYFSKNKKRSHLISEFLIISESNYLKYNNNEKGSFEKADG